MWKTKATMWEFLALSMQYPTEMLMDIVKSGEWREAAMEIAEALDTTLPEGFAENISERDITHMRADATRIFIGTPTAMCTPYEGVWRAKENGVKALLFINPYAMEVERTLKRFGLGHPEGTNEPLDHIVTECEFMEYLCLVLSGDAELNPGVTVAEQPGGVEGAYDEFIDKHVKAWMPAFAKQLEEVSESGYYTAVAQLYSAFLSTL